MPASRHSERSVAKSRNPGAISERHVTGSLDFARDDLFEKLLCWFARNGRDLPWRRTRDPYAVLVSEVMLQQTAVSTVIPRFRDWMRRFPNLQSLANADESEVLHAWQGLGYYARARNLRRCAKRVAGNLPDDPMQLRSLPGLGRYTANAVCVFAFNQPLPLVEANTARVLARLFNIREPIDTSAGQNALWNASSKLVPEQRARDFHSALMDLGALVCTSQQPQCGVCPIQNFCTAPNPRLLPLKRRRPDLVSLSESHAFISRRNSILLEQCRARWRGMWMLPSFDRVTTQPIYTAQFPFTHHRISLRVFAADSRAARKYERWFSADQLSAVPISSPHRRAIEALRARLLPPKMRA